MTLKVLRFDPDGVTYADPADRGFSVRFKFAQSSKSLSGIPTTNHACEIIVNDDVNVTLNGVSAVDALSLRIRTSCAKESMARLGAIMTSIGAQLDDWATEGVPSGFAPTTVPINPT